MSSRCFVVCLDSSQESFGAWTWASQNLLRSGDDVVLLTVAVLDTTSISDYTMLAMAADENVPGVIDEQAVQEARQQQMEAGEQFMNRMLAQAKADAKEIGGDFHVEGRVLTQNGSIGETIAAYLSSGRLEKDVSAVVVGSRGLGAFKRTMLGAIGMGSTSDYLCHHLQIPVVVVRETSSKETPPSASHQKRT